MAQGGKQESKQPFIHFFRYVGAERTCVDGLLNKDRNLDLTCVRDKFQELVILTPE